MPCAMTPTTTHELRAELRRLLAEGQDSAVVDLLEGLHSADVAEIAQELDTPEVLAMLQLLALTAGAAATVRQRVPQVCVDELKAQMKCEKFECGCPDIGRMVFGNARLINVTIVDESGKDILYPDLSGACEELFKVDIDKRNTDDGNEPPCLHNQVACVCKPGSCRTTKSSS